MLKSPILNCLHNKKNLKRVWQVMKEITGKQNKIMILIK